MPDSIDNVPSVPVGTHFFKQRYLYAFATQGEVHNYVRSQSSESAERLAEILAQWSQLQTRVAATITSESGIADRVPIAAIPPEHSELVQSYENDAFFKRTFFSLPTSVGMIEIDRLIAPQRTVNSNYAANLAASLPAEPTLQDLLELCVSPKRKMDPIQHLEIGQNVHVFTSPNADMRFLGAFFKPLAPQDLEYAVGGGNPAAAIISFVGYGASPVNAFHANGRVILNNGFHRVYAIRSRGITHVPLVVQHVQNPALELPDVIAGLPKSYLLSAPRPVLMKDFLVDDLSITLRFADRLKTITINVSVGQHDVPA